MIKERRRAAMANSLLGRSVLSLVCLSALGGVAACAPGPTPTPAASSAPSVPEVRQSETAKPSLSPTQPASAENVRKYFELIATNDPEEMEKAIALAAPKSLAAGYAKHQAAVHGAELDGGSETAADVLTEEGNAYIACPEGEGDQVCTKWAKVETAGGRVANFTVNDQPISGRLTVGSGDKVRVGNLGSAEFVSAYRSLAGKALFVNLVAQSRNRKISISSFSATYREPGGKQVTASNAFGPTELDADSNTRVTLVFARAKVGGVVTVDFQDAKTYDTATAKIKIA